MTRILILAVSAFALSAPGAALAQDDTYQNPQSDLTTPSNDARVLPDQMPQDSESPLYDEESAPQENQNDESDDVRPGDEDEMEQSDDDVFFDQEDDMEDDGMFLDDESDEPDGGAFIPDR